MDIRSLQYFITIVETGNISGAAKKLHISQPPLSQQIKLLESELGVLLMERGPRNITLTDAGKKLYKYALSITDITNMAVQEISDFSKGHKGVLRIGIASSCSSMLLSILEEHFHPHFPDVTYQLFEKNTFELIDLLEKSIIEIAFLRTPFQEQPFFQTEVLTEESIVAVGAPKFFDSKASVLSADELIHKPLILYRRWEHVITDYLNRHSIVPNYYCMNDDARTSLAWACAGMGIAFVPSSILHKMDIKNVCYKEIHDELLQTEIHIAWKTSGYVSPIAENFIGIVKELEVF